MTKESLNDNIIASLKGNDPSLTEVSFYHKNITTSQVSKLAEALKENTSLVKLDLPYCSINAEQSKLLAQSLKENNTLRYLDIHGNTLGVDGAKEFAELLNKNTTLQHFDIGSNKIENEGLESFLKVLAEKNNTLLQFEAGNNEINMDDDLKNNLIEVLKQNKKLHTLNLYNNNISSEIKPDIIQELRKNKHLTNFSISHESDEDKSYHDQVKTILADNIKLDQIFNLEVASSELPIGLKANGNPEIKTKLEIIDEAGKKLDFKNKLPEASNHREIKFAHADDGMLIEGKIDDINKFVKDIKLDNDLSKNKSLNVQIYGYGDKNIATQKVKTQGGKWVADNGINKDLEKKEDIKEKIDQKNYQKGLENNKVISDSIGHDQYLDNHNFNYNNQNALNGRSTHSNDSYFTEAVALIAGIVCVVGAFIYCRKKCKKKTGPSENYDDVIDSNTQIELASNDNLSPDQVFAKVQELAKEKGQQAKFNELLKQGDADATYNFLTKDLDIKDINQETLSQIVANQTQDIDQSKTKENALGQT